ncbi:lysyl-tRNA synthetase [Candidatus Nitrosoglobus terrae]|uniref:Lysine--tRNA ligase n=1 Tax=Candidatus Nitrosoglobus terrae TaxID=1630141 RepID=A0A1Q2SLR9_9GAMM|nr:lysine--tRNA ligase [Candidatus Nitrosoglobus terrae]BAW80070.1 lysyl-tRNA synthetase [Candidatus Nitrosoglobus terrae]
MAEQEESDLIAQRRAKLADLRQQGNPFPNDFQRNAIANKLHAEYSHKSADELESKPLRVKVAGRMMTRRIMGKASFVHIQDMSGQMQLYIRSDSLIIGDYQEFKRWDIGDIVGAEGLLMKTQSGELSVRVDHLQLITKSLRPLPEKFHGLADQETRYRQRYLDLIMNEATRETFRRRSRIINHIRHYLVDRGFLEVETPMMQAIPGGALARPFITYHNALDMELFLRIAPELYLKRLVVGGFEKVFEINRNFRNEGLSTRHNPEFTMLEFYQAYATYEDLMNVTESMMRELAQTILGTTTITYQGEEYDFGSPFACMTLKESILHYHSNIRPEDLETLSTARKVADYLKIPLQKNYGLGKIQLEIFEKTIEPKLKNPTFITAYPTEVSPLARRNSADPFITDRFEFFVGGREIANGFSELNDAEDQAERFRLQLQDKEAGDLEAMPFDMDYICALEYGMPPTAGEGIGIDRVVMLFTDASSIRDVLLFPHMRPQERPVES